jgi:hypothetical protein
MIGQKKRESSPLSIRVEAFALNLLHFIRGVRVYPKKHPTLSEFAKNVINLAPFDSAGSLTIGITSKELVVSGEFVAGKASSLASMLHARKVLKIFWTKGVTLEDIWTFANLMATPKLEGDELRQKLHSEVSNIDIEPLKLDYIHSEITDKVEDSQNNPEQRRRQVWLTFMSNETPIEQLAPALASEEFWEAAKAEWANSGYGDSEGFTKFMLTLGERLEDALTLLTDREREDILHYLTQMSKCLSVKDLVQIVGHEGQESRRIGFGKASLLREIDGERFIDLLAGLASRGDQGTRRFVEVYRHFAPVTKTDELLSLVKSRLSPGKDSGFAAEVWKTVENLIINLTENPFMDTDYFESLEFLADRSVSIPPEEDATVLLKNLDEYLDQLFLALAVNEEGDFQKRLIDRIEAQAEQLGPLSILGFVNLVDRTVPGLLDSVPSLVNNLFQKGYLTLSKTLIKEQQDLLAFAVNHEKNLLDGALKLLEQEEQIYKRYFLVNLLSRFSLSATPTFILKSRISPWYVARNLAIILGQQGFPQVLPTLRALSKHRHLKVRREALRALKKVQTSLETRGD